MVDVVGVQKEFSENNEGESEENIGWCIMVLAYDYKPFLYITIFYSSIVDRWNQNFMFVIPTKDRNTKSNSC